MDEDQKYTGVLPLSSEQEAALYRVEEIIPNAAAGAPVLEKTDPTKWKRWNRREQDGSSSCVYQARAKAAGIIREQETGEFVEYSAAAYNDRSNKPAEGSSPVEAFDKWREDGVGLEILEPSQKISESAFPKIKRSAFDRDVAKISRIKNYVGLRLGDFDQMIATLAATKKGIPFGFYAAKSEWNKTARVMEVKENVTPGSAYARHEVCATPNFGIFEGKEGFTFEDSSIPGIDGTGVLFMTRDFFEKRNYILPLYPTAFKTLEESGVTMARPKVRLTRELDLGDTGPDVRDLQRVMVWEGFFPANHPGSDYFGTITRDCVEKFQTRYGIVTGGTPETTGFGRVGPKTLEFINRLFA